MLSTFHGIETSKRAIFAHQEALNTTGHNIANANTEGYSRQKVVMGTFYPIYQPDLTRAEMKGQIGSGVVIDEVQRVRDSFIDMRINEEKGYMGMWKMRNDVLHQLEMIHNEPGKENIRNLLDKFWAAWQDLSRNPDNRAARQQLIQISKALTNEISSTYKRIKEVRDNMESLIRQKIDEINNITLELRDLNIQIKKSIALGDNPNDLLDRRDLLIERLSSYLKVEVKQDDPDEIMVYAGNQILVQGEHREEIVYIPNANNNGYSDIRWKGNNQLLKLESGELKALIDLRDGDIKRQLDLLDSLAINLADSVNEIHRDGFGYNNKTGLDFFSLNTITENPYGNYDLNGDGIDDISSIFKITGSRKVDINSEIGVNGVINLGKLTPDGKDILISYSARDSIKDVMDKINKSGSDIQIYQNHRGQLVIKATLSKSNEYPDFVIRHLEDSGQFLVGIAGILQGSGLAGAYDFRRTNEITRLQNGVNFIGITPQNNAALNIRLNPVLEQDPESIASSGGIDTDGDGIVDTPNGSGDGSIALKIAQLRLADIFIGTSSTFDKFLTNMVAEVGSAMSEASMKVEKQEVVLKNLENLRKSVSGVNIDEELANMLLYQHGYQAAAKMISVFDRMIDTIINRMAI